MRIAIAGATGLAGRKVVSAARKAGHDVVELSRARGVDLTGTAPLEDVLAGVDAVIDVTNPPSSLPTDRQSVTTFFEHVAARLGDAARRAGVKRTVVLSIVGVDRTPEDDYFVAKLAHERATLAHGPGPRVLRATQFHEFAEQSFGWGLAGDVCTVRDMPIQPVALDQVVAQLVAMATDADHRPHVELAGPRPERLVELVRTLAERKQAGIKIEPAPPSQQVRDGALLPGPDAMTAGPSFADWLAASSR